MRINRMVIPNTGRAAKATTQRGPLCQRCFKPVRIMFVTMLCDTCIDWEIAYLRRQTDDGSRRDQSTD